MSYGEVLKRSSSGTLVLSENESKQLSEPDAALGSRKTFILLFVCFHSASSCSSLANRNWKLEIESREKRWAIIIRSQKNKQQKKSLTIAAAAGETFLVKFQISSPVLLFSIRLLVVCCSRSLVFFYVASDNAPKWWFFFCCSSPEFHIFFPA